MITDMRTASILKDEQGRPFIVVREYVLTYQEPDAGNGMLMVLQPGQEEEAAWHRGHQVAYCCC